jgi:hypothetical protein
MPESAIQLLLQLPIVGIFVFFILEWSKRMEKSQEDRETKWREFLREEREQRSENARRLAEEIKSVSQEVSRMSGIITAHDARSQVRAEQGRATGQLKPKDP